MFRCIIVANFPRDLTVNNKIISNESDVRSEVSKFSNGIYLKAMRNTVLYSEYFWVYRPEFLPKRTRPRPLGPASLEAPIIQFYMQNFQYGLRVSGLE